MSDPVVQLVRQRGSRALRAAIVGDQQLGVGDVANDDDQGWFEPTSAIRQVHGDASMLIGGLRALLLQTAHPLAMAGIADHSDYRKDPWGRLQRTSRFVAATTYGTTQTAEQAISVVRSVHERVTGIAPDGRPYAANDPHLLLWVHVTEVDSFLAAYDAYGDETLLFERRDEYVADMARIAEALGSEPPPRTEAELRQTLRNFKTECRPTPASRRAARFLLAPPGVSLLARPAYGLLAAAAVGLLPRSVRLGLGLAIPPLVEPVAIRPAARALTDTLGWLMSDESDLESAS